jgi:hypothetical protein
MADQAVQTLNQSPQPAAGRIRAVWAYAIVGAALLVVSALTIAAAMRTTMPHEIIPPAIAAHETPAPADVPTEAVTDTAAPRLMMLLLIAALTGFASMFCLVIAALRIAAHRMVLPQVESLSERLADMATLLDSINDRLLVSDMAKRIAYRGKDRQVLRDAIRDDLNKGDFDAAMVMVNQMSETYGYREEAEEFRQQIMKLREADISTELARAVRHVDELTTQEAWEQAFAEVARIQRMYPEAPRAAELPQRVRQAFENRKHELERAFLRAAERDDVDQAMDLLRRLDHYLTEQEAEPFRETARGVIGKKRDNLGVQFKLAVHDKEWTRAVEVGQQIIREFPNTKMADEVRQMLDMIRQRSADEQAANQQIFTR